MKGLRGGSGALTGFGVAVLPMKGGAEVLPWGIGWAGTPACAICGSASETASAAMVTVPLPNGSRSMIRRPLPGTRQRAHLSAAPAVGALIERLGSAHGGPVRVSAGCSGAGLRRLRIERADAAREALARAAPEGSQAGHRADPAAGRPSPAEATARRAPRSPASSDQVTADSVSGQAQAGDGRLFPAPLRPRHVPPDPPEGDRRALHRDLDHGSRAAVVEVGMA